MAYEELFLDLLRAEREEDVTDALTVFGLEKFSDSNWPGAPARCPRFASIVWTLTWAPA